MRRLKAGGLTARALARLRESPVPVRTGVLAAQLGAHRSAMWQSLERLRRRGLAAKAAGRCPQTGVPVATWQAAPVPAPAAPVPDETVDAVVSRHVRATLARHGGERGRAAAALGVSRRTLASWLRRWAAEGRAR